MPSWAAPGQEWGLALRCRVCEQDVPLRDMCSNPRAVNGFETRCRSCAAERSRRYKSEVGYERGGRRPRVVATEAKTCRWCLISRPISDFVLRRSSANGRYYARSECNHCVADPDSKFRRHRANYNKQYQTGFRREVERTTPRHHARRLLNSAQRRAREKGVPFELNVALRAFVASALQEGVCELTGLPIEPNAGRRTPFSPSLDRISPALGYIPGNVRVVCWAVNAMVGDWGDDVAAQVAEAFLAKRAEKLRVRLPDLAPIVHAHPSTFPEPFVPC